MQRPALLPGSTRHSAGLPEFAWLWSASDVFQGYANLSRLGGALPGKGLGLLFDLYRRVLALDLFADPPAQELDRMFTHTAFPWRLCRLVIVNVRTR